MPALPRYGAALWKLVDFGLQILDVEHATLSTVRPPSVPRWRATSPAGIRRDGRRAARRPRRSAAPLHRWLRIGGRTHRDRIEYGLIVGELEITRRISPVAVCCSSDLDSSRVRSATLCSKLRRSKP